MKKRKLWNGESGQAMVLFALMFAVFCGFSAFAIDIGRVAIAKDQLQNVADAAALAAAHDLPQTSTATNTAFFYAEQNGVDQDDVTVTPNYKGRSDQIKVACKKNMKYTFAQIFGLTSTDVTASAVAQRGGVSTGISGVRPWALEDQYEVTGGTKKDPTSEWVDYVYTYGEEFELKIGGGGGSNGYYGIVAFEGQNASSANVYKDNITNGYDGVIKIGDYVYDGPGNKNVKQTIEELMTRSDNSGGQYENATEGDSRVVIVPKIDAQTLTVIGFAAIYLESVDNQGYITAVFLYDTTWSEEDQAAYYDWGLNSKITLVG